MIKTSSLSEDSQKRITTVAYYVAFITLGLTVGATGPVLPTLAKHTHTALDGISLIFVTNALGYLAGSWIGGHAYDRIPGHLLMAVALVTTSIMLFFLPIISILWMLALLMAVLGFFQGSVDVGGNTLLIWLHGSQVGPFMNGLHFFFGFGAFVAPIVVAQITGLSGDIYWVYWLFAIVNIPIALWIWTLPSPKVPPKTTTADEPKVHASPFILASLVAFFFLYVGIESGYGNWIYTYAITLKMADATWAAYLTSTFWGAFTLFRLISVWISTKTSPQNILFANFAMSAVGLGLVLFMPGSQSALWAGTFILGAGIASIFPTMMTLIGQRMHLTGSITSWCFAGASVGHMTLPWLIGQIFEPLGATSMMVLLMIDLLLNVVILGLVLGKSKNA
jgi:MFS transporter, FHS family, Na+ dependent glucose transporter 1